MRFYHVFGCLLFVVGCASTSPAPALRDTSHMLYQRSKLELTWLANEHEQERARSLVTKILSQKLTLDRAIQVTLLANRSLQASYEEVGISQADLVQAGLLKNPVLSGSYQFPIDGGHGSSIPFNLVANLVHWLTTGSRKDIARVGLEGAKFRVASEVLRHRYEVKAAFYAAQAAQQIFSMRQIVTEAAQAAVELARKQHEAGTINDLDLANEEALYAQISMDFTRSRTEIVSTRERLNRLMGVWGRDAGWTIQNKLEDLPSKEPSLTHIESKAIASRFDLMATHKDVEVVSYGLALAKNTRWFGGVDAGISFEKKAEGYRLLGPSISVELPIFDQRQATIARLEAQLRQAQHREAALAIEIRSEVRELSNRLLIARSVLESYQRALVPLREKVVQLSQQQYNAMLLGVFQLLIAKQNEINTYREFIEALRDYWTLRAELEWKVGGQLPNEY